MKSRIRITSIRREPLDIDLLAQILIELVLHEREQERLAAERAGTRKKENDGERA